VAAASTAVVVTLMDVPSGCVTVVVVEDITVVVEGTAVRVLDLALLLYGADQIRCGRLAVRARTDSDRSFHL
jgi:hypothetical protein